MRMIRTTPKVGHVPSMRTRYTRGQVTTQNIGNIGLFFTCYQLSLFGWNVMPTSRNAKGADILIYSQDANRKLLVQVKTLSSKSPVPLGPAIHCLLADYVVICVRT